jgi:hypothetical protein
MFNVDKDFEKGIEFTQIKDISYQKHTKAIFNTTYLNSTNDDIWDNEFYNFLLGIYIVDNNEYIHNKDYTITLNGNSITKFEALTETNALFNNIPAKNPYAKYYIVSFDKKEISTSSLKLSISHLRFGKVIVSF